MTQYRVKCPSSQCGHIGMTEGTPAAGAFVKKHFADINNSKKAKERADEVLVFRCHKCKCRWRMRSSQVSHF
jgi:hypothetical protein